MPKSFKARIIVSVMLLHALLITIIIIEISFRQIDSARTSSKDTANTLVSALAVSSPSWLISNDLNALSEIVSSIKVTKNIKAVYICDKYNIVKASTDTGSLHNILNDKLSLKLISELNASNTKPFFLEHDDVADAIIAIKANNKTIGYARVILDNSLMIEEIAQIWKLGALYILIAMIFGGALAYYAIKSMLTQMEQLSNAANEISNGNDHVEIEITNENNEVNKLAIVLSNMVTSLQEKITQSQLQQELLREQAYELETINKNLEELVETETNKRIEKEHMLIQQNKLAALGEMIGAIAHQWRQPLNSLGISIQDLVYAKKAGELDDEYLINFKDESMVILKRLSKTIDDFRNFFKPNKKMDKFCVEDIIASTLAIIDAQLKNNFIDVEFDSECRHYFVGFEGEFGQVILNLLSNAKDAILSSSNKRDGKITIITYENERNIVIELGDNGGGIKDEHVERVFEPYFTTKEQGQGVGIGLYMSKEIIERHLNGKLSAHNYNDGAVLKIELPKSAQE